MSSAAATIELDAQYRQLREECGVLDRSGRGRLVVRGAEAAEYLQGQLTNDIEALEPGQGCYAALLDRKGHLQADMRVLRASADEIVIDTEAVATEATRRHLDTYRIGRDVELFDQSGERGLLSLIGPRSGEIAGALPGALHAFAACEIGGVECIAIAARDGVDLDHDRAATAALRGELLARGAVDVGEDAAEIVRIESGTPRFGAEMSTATMPAEAGIVESAVAFTKGCYIGQETVARLHYRGKPNRLLRGLRLEAPVAPGAPLHLGEREVGEIGSSCVSPRFGAIALAILRREAGPGTALEAGDGVGAEVVELPFAR